MRRIGFRTASIKRFATESQMLRAQKLADEAERDGASLVEVRLSAYCGPASPGSRGSLTFLVDGRISTFIEA